MALGNVFVQITDLPPASVAVMVELIVSYFPTPKMCEPGCFVDFEAYTAGDINEAYVGATASTGWKQPRDVHAAANEACVWCLSNLLYYDVPDGFDMGMVFDRLLTLCEMRECRYTPRLFDFEE